MMRKRLVRIAFLVSVGLTLSLAFAASVDAISPDFTLRELAEQSRLILTGQVVGVQAEQMPDGMIYTYATVEPLDVLKGTAGSQIVIQAPGGEVGEIGLRVSDAPTFEVGQQALFFLDDSDGYQVVGWAQGKHNIRGGMLDNGVRLADVESSIAGILRGESVGDSISMAAVPESVDDGVMLSFAWAGNFWPGENPMSETMRIYENTSDCVGEGQAIIRAMETWSNVDCSSFRYTYGGPTAVSVPALDGINAIRWKSLGTTGVLGATYSWYNVPDLSFFEADVVFNDDYPWSADEVCPYNRLDIQDVASHELGHVLGLKDLYGSADTEKTMFGYSNYAETKKRTLEPDDIAGVRAIYPAPCGGAPGLTPTDNWCTPDSWQTFVAVYQSSQGWQNIRYADFMVNDTAASATGSLYARYDVQRNLMFLRNPTDTAWQPLAGGKTPGVAAIIMNNYARLDVGQSSVTADGNQLTISWRVLFTWRQSGQEHRMFLATVEQDTAPSSEATPQSEMLPATESDWVEEGSWTVNRLPNWLIPPTSLSPLNSTVSAGQLVYFDPGYRDPDLYQDLSELYILVTDGTPSTYADWSQAPAGVLLMYKQSENKLYLRDTRTLPWRWVPYDPLTGSTAVNIGYASIVTRWSKVVVADYCTLKLLWRLSFNSNYLGTHKVYTRAVDRQGNLQGGDTAWKWKGKVTIQ